MNKFFKHIILILTISFIFMLVGCKDKNLDTENLNHPVNALYEKNSYILSLEYNDLDYSGLSSLNNKTLESGFSSLTFGEYSNGDISSIRNKDYKDTKSVGYEFIVRQGENVKYPFWGISYSNDDEKDYYEYLKNGISDAYYKEIPFAASDTMSFGYTDDGDRFCLYASLQERYDDSDECVCLGTYPNAHFKCNAQSLPALIASNCITIDEALQFTGALNEDYTRIYESVNPLVNVYTSDVNVNGKSFHKLYSCCLEDSSGRHGVLEFSNNKVIWHEGLDYCFNFALQKDFLLNEDNTYKTNYVNGLGRFNATVLYLDQVLSMEDHLRLMNGISYSFVTYYDEELGYTGYDFKGNKVDWRSEFVYYDVFKKYDEYKKMNLDTSKADELYPLYSHYLDVDTDEIILIDSYDAWLENNNHLKCIYDIEYCLDDSNIDELTNFIKWNGAFHRSLSSDDRELVGDSFTTILKVIGDPMNYRVTRWFNEEVATADTISFSDIYTDNNKQ